MLTRRAFAVSSSKAIFAVILGASMLTGCSAVTDLENWIPVALSAVSAIVKLLGPIVPAPVAATIMLISAGFSALLTALQNYKAGTGILADVTNAIAAVESAFSSFFASLNVPAALLNTIEGLAAIILSTLQAFANELGSSTTASATLSGGKVAYTPEKRSVSKFRKDWNAEAVKDGVPEARI
jgi:hypothetical protein